MKNNTKKNTNSGAFGLYFQSLGAYISKYYLYLILSRREFFVPLRFLLYIHGGKKISTRKFKWVRSGSVWLPGFYGQFDKVEERLGFILY